MIKYAISIMGCSVYGLITAILMVKGEDLPSSSFWWLMLTLFFAGWGITDIIDELLPERKSQ